MNNTEFKTLMHCGFYVNPSLLENGIYASGIPTLYEKNESIESISEEYRNMAKVYGGDFLSDSFFDNLQKCQLVSITITVNTSKQ